MQMTSFPRYAIYYAPAAGSTLDRFGASLLGYDAWTGEEQLFPEDICKSVPDWRDLTEDPRKYGFHGTLKAPFALAAGSTETDVLAALAEFAATKRSIPVVRPVVDAISGFIAVVPAERSDELQQLAADCVARFDSLRAPLTPQGRARRKPESLTPRQCQHLDRWGYPYVLDEFRFHMTLTGRLGVDRRGPILAMLRNRFSATRIAQLAIDRIVLFRQSEASARFRIVGHWPLRD